MRLLIGSDGRSYAAPKTVLAEPYHGATYELRQSVTLPAGTVVRQTPTGVDFGFMEALIDHVWTRVTAP